MSTKRTCSIDGCENPYYARAWCNKHYKRWRMHGDPVWTPPTPEAKFWARVRVADVADPDACWLWTAGRTGPGYGVLLVEGRQVYAHRFAYGLLVGPIPEGLVPDHLCRVRHCVNPDHLEPVTSRENTLRGDTHAARNAAKTHCPQGHEYSPENTRLYQGRRFCRACSRDRKKAG